MEQTVPIADSVKRWGSTEQRQTDRQIGCCNGIIAPMFAQLLHAGDPHRFVPNQPTRSVGCHNHVDRFECSVYNRRAQQPTGHFTKRFTQSEQRASLSSIAQFGQRFVQPYPLGPFSQHHIDIERIFHCIEKQHLLSVKFVIYQIGSRDSLQKIDTQAGRHTALFPIFQRAGQFAGALLEPNPKDRYSPTAAQEITGLTVFIFEMDSRQRFESSLRVTERFEQLIYRNHHFQSISDTETEPIFIIPIRSVIEAL